jgi:hypothetical protein
MGEAEDAWINLQKWLKRTGRVPWGTKGAQPEPKPSTTHPIWAAVLTVVGVFGLIAAAIDHYGHDKYRSAVWFWVVVGGIATVVAIYLWIDVLIDRRR